MIDTVFTFLVAGFVVFYGCCLMGWPMDVTRGVGWLQRRSRVTRRLIGAALVAGGLAAMWQAKVKPLGGRGRKSV